jgi:ATP:cob(I)alamin adenosyltransferase
MMNKLYRSPYEAYPFLSDESEDLRCDFEIYTDKLSSMTGLLSAMCQEIELQKDLQKVDDLIYHSNPTLRTKMTVTEEEVQWLKTRVDALRDETKDRCERFVLPYGSKRAALSHVLRAECKGLVRLLYRYNRTGKNVEPLLYDFTNLLSGYFFVLSLKLNALDGIDEIPYISRNYIK